MPLRKLGDEHKLSGAQAYARVVAELNTLPDNTKLTKLVCDHQKFSHILVLDGKYLKVRGFKKGAPFIYGIDYLTHDIPVGMLARAEDETEFIRFFRELERLRYYPNIVIADDRKGLKPALLRVFPYYTRLQLCQVHYLENIRKLLRVRTDPCHLYFFNSLKLHVFIEPKSLAQVRFALKQLDQIQINSDPLRRSSLWGIGNRLIDLFAYFDIPQSPNNTNLIELYNSHLQARLKSLKGFKSFLAAKRWLNAYIIRRRTKPLTDCEATFKHLNGFASLQLTIKKQATWPDILGIKPPEKALKTER